MLRAHGSTKRGMGVRKISTGVKKFTLAPKIFCSRGSAATVLASSL
jgi:hypothetical protein